MIRKIVNDQSVFAVRFGRKVSSNTNFPIVVVHYWSKEAERWYARLLFFVFTRYKLLYQCISLHTRTVKKSIIIVV